MMGCRERQTPRTGLWWGKALRPLSRKSQEAPGVVCARRALDGEGGGDGEVGEAL